MTNYTEAYAAFNRGDFISILHNHPKYGGIAQDFHLKVSEAAIEDFDVKSFDRSSAALCEDAKCLAAANTVLLLAVAELREKLEETYKYVPFYKTGLVDGINLIDELKPLLAATADLQSIVGGA